MKLKFFSTIFEFIQSQNLIFEIHEILTFIGNGQEETLRFVDLVNYLEFQKPGFKDLIINNGKIKANFNIILNGYNIEHLDGLKTPVSANDQLAFFPPIGGG